MCIGQGGLQDSVFILSAIPSAIPQTSAISSEIADRCEIQSTMGRDGMTRWWGRFSSIDPLT